MRFEWDPKKARRNLAKHGIAFEEALTVFYDPLSIAFEDTGHSLDEERFITVGYSSRGRLLVVSYADLDGKLRLISARKATTGERKRHEETS